MLTIDRLCARMIRLIHTPVRIYDKTGNQTAVYTDNGEQQDPVACDAGLRQLLLEQCAPDHPSLYLGDEDVVYGVFGDEENTYILGPCCLGRDPAAISRKLVHRHRMNPDKPYRAVRVSLSEFCETLLILFECLTDIHIEVDQLYRKIFYNEQFEQSIQQKIQEVSYTLQENAIIHNPYSQELMEQESIRAGDLEGLCESFRIPYVGKLGTLSHDPLRQAKNILIVVTTLASRSAIRGGLLPEVSFSMSDAFIQRAEELQTEGEVNALLRQIEVEYCKAVAELSKTGMQNSLITRCKELVLQQLHSRITAKDLAQQLEITPGYLSHLFLKEEGVKLTDYILQEKVSAAKGQLAYSDRSYKAVAMSLGFVSQSHFGQVFKKYTGTTPKQYRETHSQPGSHKNRAK